MICRLLFLMCIFLSFETAYAVRLSNIKKPSTPQIQIMPSESSIQQSSPPSQQKNVSPWQRSVEQWNEQNTKQLKINPDDPK